MALFRKDKDSLTFSFFQIEEQILEAMAWQSDSPLWAVLNTLDQVPSCEEVTVPQNIEPAVSSAQGAIRSPIIHPRVVGISGEMTARRGLASIDIYIQ